MYAVHHRRAGERDGDAGCRARCARCARPRSRAAGTGRARSPPSSARRSRVCSNSAARGPISVSDGAMIPGVDLHARTCHATARRRQARSRQTMTEVVTGRRYRRRMESSWRPAVRSGALALAAPPCRRARWARSRAARSPSGSRYLERLPEPPTAPACKGTLVHLALQHLMWRPRRRAHDRRRARGPPARARGRARGRSRVRRSSSSPRRSGPQFHADAEVLVRRYFEMEDPRDRHGARRRAARRRRPPTTA